MKFKLSFSSQIKLMNLIMEVIEGFIKSYGIDTEKNWKVFLALREILTNSIIHGNREDPDKMVHIEAEINEAITFTVKDQGEKFDFYSYKEIPKNLLAQRGRGIYLAHQIMDEIIYEFNNGNIITMKKRL